MVRFQPLILTALLAGAPAWADDRPNLQPSRDVQIEYLSEGSARQGPHIVTMHVSATSHRMRIDPGDASAYMIMEPQSKRVTMVMLAQHKYMERVADPAMAGTFHPTDVQFAKVGRDTVAGLSCTVYETKSDTRRGQVCLTDDGVMLRSRRDGVALSPGQ